MTSDVLEAAVKLNLALDRALLAPEFPPDELMKIMAAAINILMYDRIDTWVTSLKLKEEVEKFDVSS